MRLSGRLPILAMVFAAVAVPAVAEAPFGLRLLSVQKVWDAAPHNAFTDLAWFQGQWYLGFREADSHAVSGDGSARVIRSTDGQTWESAALLDYGAEWDTRDAKLTVLADGRLMLNTAAAPLDATNQRQSAAWFSTDGTDWTDGPHDIGEYNWWLWGIAAASDGTVYGVGYGDLVQDGSNTTTRLYRSTDGVHYQTLVPTLTSQLGTNEVGLTFRRDGSAVALVRRDGSGAQSLVGTASGDYTNWTFRTIDKAVGGPEIIQLPGGQMLAATRLYDGTVRTSLSWLDPEAGTLTELLTLPSGGDTSYPGMVWRDGRLYVSYYSSHEGKASIYFAQVEVTQPTVPTPNLICRHRGSANPVTEGWSLYGSGTGCSEAAITGDPVGGLDAWEIDDASTAGGSIRAYKVTPCEDQMNQAAQLGWVLSARLRVVDSPDALDYSVYAEYASNVAALDRRFYMGFGSDASGHPIVELGGGSRLTLSNLDGGYHLYELKYDPTAGSADLFVDGTERISDYAGAANSGLARLMWGANQSGSTGQGRYNLIEFYNTGVASLPGDANRDGKVDDLDASILAAHWQMSGALWPDGDFNGDGNVNDLDASILAAHWQAGVGGAVPEPGWLALLIGAMLLLLARHRRSGATLAIV